MREYKFRGKRISNGEWVYGWYHRLDHADHRGKAYIIPSYASALYSFEVDPETVGQYTGHTDRNGKEIYEGDIVKTIALLNDHHQRGAIAVSPIEIWNGNTCLSITHVPIYPFCLVHEIEVIGNVHDNPELLEP